ncbi:CDP-glycerol glycerophosphotransferase family protein [Fervidibacillus halotolerans]|uniref:CDP-glycerol glycerophosphotransferase family protein n=1 Tax=Fervidibacillus halotolerans TaxID=2980027 RepID=A0A9E8LYL1_9BACI|nr:CDP-glycerol glycerophosphotransferase family protein [Fervidibacillus halotolerans]WAA12130.1 CDP-glycerol glycerophosphotransferase family protein [Fervidibacillus halotolerans]
MYKQSFVREWFIEVYLVFHKILFFFLKKLPVKNKIVFVASFKENNLYIYRELKRRKYDGEIVFLCKKHCYNSIQKASSVPVYKIESGKITDEIKAAYHLMTAKKIITDNYFGVFAVAPIKEETECIQIWHAAGAIKKFGLMDHATKKRSNRAKKRFLKVYSKFDKVVVNSDAFAKQFEAAFLLSENQFLRFGFPRTDFFFNESKIREKKNIFFRKYPAYKGKKIILYAPTFRPNPKDNELNLDIPLLYEKLHGEYVLFIRMHPSVSMPEQMFSGFEDFVVDFSKKASINELMVVSDLLITDYSSIPFEYVLLKKPMIFYPYDLESYKRNPGIWEPYEEMVPGAVAHNTSEILDVILNHTFNEENYIAFHQKWNTYTTGESSEKLVQYLMRGDSPFERDSN